MTEAPQSPGRIIWTSTDNLLRFAAEFDAFWEKLCQKAETFDCAGRGQLRLSFQDEDWWNSENDWLCLGQTARFHVEEIGMRGRRPRRGCVTFLAQIWSDHERAEDGMPPAWEHAQTPKLFTGYSRENNDWWERHLLVLNEVGLPADQEIKAIGPYLWSDSDETQSGVFCVPLDRINTEKDMERELLEPLWRLFQGEDQEQAFKDAQATCRIPTANQA